MNRFRFQRACVEKTQGRVLNIGSKEDPALLKSYGAERVLNCDITTWDSDYQRRISIDVVMDCREWWPFEDKSAEMVVFGDILEHLYLDEAIFALEEAIRVADKLCITVPGWADKHRREHGGEQWVAPEGNRGHCIDWSEALLRSVLEKIGWEIIEFHTIDYEIVPEGYLVYAECS